MLLIDEQIPLLSEIFSQVDTVRTVNGRTLTREHIVRFRATGLFIRSTTRIDRATVEHTHVRFIATATSGTDHIDLQAMQELGIAVYDAAGSNANAVAEYVIAGTLHTGIDLVGARVGVVGYGCVGEIVSTYFERLGATVVLHDPIRALWDGTLEHRHLSLDEVLATCNIITFHPSLHTEEPYPSLHLLSAANVGLILPNAVVINTSRGEVITTDAVQALLQRSEGRTILDTWPAEPHPDAAHVSSAFIATPHVAGYTINAKEQGALMVAERYIQENGLDMTLLDSVTLHASHSHDIVWQQQPLRELLLTQRPIDRDSAVFKSAYLASPGAAAFDAARKDYPLRVETLHE